MDELAHLGVSAPTRTPIYMKFSFHPVSAFQTVEVITEETSGKMEYVASVDEKGKYVAVGSDHTDRGFEKHGIGASKQMYAKVIAPVIWPYEEVKDHWDQIIIRSWTTRDGKRVLYQEDPLAEIVDLGYTA